MVHARFELDDYTTRVLDVIKGKYGLKSREEALKRLVVNHGDTYIEPEFDAKEVKALRRMADAYDTDQRRSMTLDELDRLLGI